MTAPVRGGALVVDRSDGHGPAVVFLHYWGGTARTWDYVCERLGAIPTVRYDQRGWSRSADLPGPYGLDELADDALAVVDSQVNGDWVLVGHSMGGKVSMLVAARKPVGLKSLVLVAPAPPKPNPAVSPDVQAQLAAAYSSAESVHNALVTAHPLSDHDTERIVSDSLSGTPDAVAEWPARGITADITSAVTGLDLPISVIVGGKDVVEPADVLRTNLAQIVANVSVTVVPDVGHLVPYEAPEAIASAIQAALRDAR